MYPKTLTKRQITYLKRKYSIDRFLGICASVVLLPVFALLAVLIFIDDPGPIIFKQKRVGNHKKYFHIYKFRTMKVDTPKDVPTHLLKNPDQYITRMGHFLRKTSLDELPQVFNIAKGEICVCGPRPALWNQDDLIKERDRYGANDIKPGLTGWAQINGRDELPIDVKAELDGEYVKKLGLIMDLCCFFGTFAAVFAGKGVVEGGTGAMEAAVAKEKYGQIPVRKKKILIMTNHSFMLWQFRRELIAELLKENTVILSMPCGEHVDDFRKLGCKIINTDIDRRGINPFTDITLLRRYFYYLKKVKPDLVITYSIKPNIYGGFACRMSKIPYCVNVQGLGTAFQKPLLAWLVGFMYKIALKDAKTVFFENEGNAKVFQDKKIIPIKKQKILHGAGINLERFYFREYPNNDRVHFLYVGRIMKEKGIDELFAAVRSLYAERKDFVLDIVGFYEDDYKEQVNNLVQDGIAIYHGFQENPIPYYAASDCIVLPSYHEGMSNVLLEAAAIGRPLITSDIPGCREAVDPGLSGILVKVKNTDSLRDGMEIFLDKTLDERILMGKAGRQKMEREFDKAQVVKETIQALSVE